MKGMYVCRIQKVLEKMRKKNARSKPKRYIWNNSTLFHLHEILYKRANYLFVLGSYFAQRAAPTRKDVHVYTNDNKLKLIARIWSKAPVERRRADSSCILAVHWAREWRSPENWLLWIRWNRSPTRCSTSSSGRAARALLLCDGRAPPAASAGSGRERTSGPSGRTKRTGGPQSGPRPHSGLRGLTLKWVWAAASGRQVELTAPAGSMLWDIVKRERYRAAPTCPAPSSAGGSHLSFEAINDCFIILYWTWEINVRLMNC